jgi:hypothetical protein
MYGAIPSLPNTLSWCGAQLKHRDNFTFTFTFYFDGWMDEWMDPSKLYVECHIPKIPRNEIELQKHIPRTKYTTVDLIIYMITLLVIP